MFEFSADRVVKFTPAKYEPFKRAPDFGPEDGCGWYVQVKAKGRTFLIKGQGKGKLALKEIGLGSSGIGWQDLARDRDITDIIDHLDSL